MTLSINLNLTQISTQELAKKAFVLAVGNSIDFSCQQEEDYIWGISKIRELDADLIIWGIYGGGMSFMHDLTADSDATELATSIKRSLPPYAEKKVWIKTNKQPAESLSNVSKI